MKATLKKILCSLLTCALTLSTAYAAPALDASAKESIGNGLILSTDNILVTEGSFTTFTASLGGGFDASRLAVVVADPDIVAIIPTTYAANVAAYQVVYMNSGSTIAAVYDLDNPAVVAYLSINATPLIMEIPAKLGTSHDNYCTLVSYGFSPYDSKYGDFNDFTSTLNLQYQCVSYEDDGFSKWGCYGYFYDAAGNVLSTAHLYCSTLVKGRQYHSEFNVPVNAVRFTIEGFN